MPAKLSTHVLDLTRGAPAAGMEIELWSLAESPQQIKVVITNADGRTDAPLLTGDELKAGDYQLVFKIKDYFAQRGVASTFFVYAAIFFRVEDPAASYHVPLLVTLIYGFGVALAAFAGVLAAPIAQVSPKMGSDLIITVFAVVVVGGMGSILGSIVTGLVLGIVEVLTKVIYPEASAIVIFLIMAVVLMIRPTGLFGRQP
jgi:hydroxyisourate hydrolase